MYVHMYMCISGQPTIQVWSYFGLCTILPLPILYVDGNTGGGEIGLTRLNPPGLVVFWPLHDIAITILYGVDGNTGGGGGRNKTVSCISSIVWAMKGGGATQ